MHTEDIRKRMLEVEARHGRWAHDNIRLADDLYTIHLPHRHEPGMPYTGDEGVDPGLRCLVQAAADLAGRPLKDLRILDVGPREGLVPAEFARHGAEVVALAPHEATRDRLLFLKDVLELERLTVRPEDVSQLQPGKDGPFDVVVCAGVLDTLDSAEFHPVLKQAADLCGRLALIDTHVSLADREAYVRHGLIYWGRTVSARPAGHAGLATNNAPAAGTPFWLTRPSLLNLLRHVGFTSVFECHSPAGFAFADRHVFAALKGERQPIQTAPLLNEAEDDRPEKVHLSAPPQENADAYYGHEELVANFQHLQFQYDELYERHAPFTYLGGTLRQLPRMFWQAVRRRLPGGRKQDAPGPDAAS